MANIVGEPFDPYVSKQIIDRQKTHGQGFEQNRDNLTLSYLNSKTSWIKLSSGVAIGVGIDNFEEGREKLKKLGLGDHPSFYGPDQSDINNNKITGLSNFFVLFNGTSDNNGTPYGGIDIINGKNPNQNLGQSILNKVAYGIGGTEFGLKPMPGIISAETKFRNRGSIREGTINIKAHNRTQLEIIDLLYLRLGFPMLLEWGHSIIVDKDGKINTKPDFSISKEFLSLKYKNDNEILTALEEKRKESAGNYDAMYGRVVNFDWSFNPDGSYNITLKLISIGAIIESLRTNVLTSSTKSTSVKSNSDEQEINTTFDWIVKYKNSHEIGKVFFEFVSSKEEILENVIESAAAKSSLLNTGLKFQQAIIDVLPDWLTDTEIGKKTIRAVSNDTFTNYALNKKQQSSNPLIAYPSSTGDSINFIKIVGKAGVSFNKYPNLI